MPLIFLTCQVETRQRSLEEQQLDAARGASSAARIETQLKERVQSLSDQLDATQSTLRQRSEELAAKNATVATLQSEFQAYKVTTLRSLKVVSHQMLVLGCLNSSFAWSQMPDRQVKAQSVLKQRQDSAQPQLDELRAQVGHSQLNPIICKEEGQETRGSVRANEEK